MLPSAELSKKWRTESSPYIRLHREVAHLHRAPPASHRPSGCEPPAEILSTTTKAWWLGITGAGTPDLRVQFVGSPDGGLDDIPNSTIEKGVLHYVWSRTGRDGTSTRIDYEIKLVDGKLEGRMSGPKESLTFTGFRAPEINEHDDDTWIRAKPIVLFNGTDLNGWTGVLSPKAEGWKVESRVLTGTGHADDLITADKYWNFELHAEFKLAERSNSRIGLRGRYEVQIASDYGRPPRDARHRRALHPDSAASERGEEGRRMADL
jgi:hypothetical protein